MSYDPRQVKAPDFKENKVELEKPKEEKSETPVLTVMSEEDRYIADRMKSQPKTLDEVLVVKEKVYAPGEHRLTLPKELKAFEDRLIFRWINKKKRAVDESILKGWTIVNRSLFPDIAREARHLFSTSGAIEKGDCILACISKTIGLSIRKAPGEKSSGLVKAQLSKGNDPLPKGKSGFYKPTDTSENEEAGVAAGGGLQEGRDF